MSFGGNHHPPESPLRQRQSLLFHPMNPMRMNSPRSCRSRKMRLAYPMWPPRQTEPGVEISGRPLSSNSQRDLGGIWPSGSYCSVYSASSWWLPGGESAAAFYPRGRPRLLPRKLRKLYPLHIGVLYRDRLAHRHRPGHRVPPMCRPRRSQPEHLALQTPLCSPGHLRSRRRQP